MNTSPALKKTWWLRMVLLSAFALVTVTTAVSIFSTHATRATQRPKSVTEAIGAARPLVTGKTLAPQGDQTPVGSFPNHLLRSPDGRFIIVSSSGARSFLTVLSAETGQTLSHVGFNSLNVDKARTTSTRTGLYYGLVFGPQNADGSTTVYAARGADAVISVLHLSQSGVLSDTGSVIAPPTNTPERDRLQWVAGIALTPDNQTLIAANNTINPKSATMSSTISLLSASSGALKATLPVPGYPYAVVALTAGTQAGTKVYVGSEQRPVVTVINPQTQHVVREITVDSHPIAFALDKAQKRLFVANANSDTVSVVDTASDKVQATLLLRPTEIGGLTGATPTGLALSPDEATLYVSLADMNAVAVVDVARRTVSGYLPVGWYPTAVAVSADGNRLFVANARGVRTRTPNNVPFPPAVAAGNYRSKSILSTLEGTVSSISLGNVRVHLKDLTQQTLAANHFFAGLPQAARAALKNPGIEHVIYIVKENRTYDQVLGDLPQGNGDKSLVMFGRDVTPNLHALAERFVLLDNFYCAAEVSGDGWNWSTTGMANEYVSRNVPYSYTGRSRSYDYEGTNRGIAVERFNVPDVGTPQSGYLWDQAARAKHSFRNYGMFTDDVKKPRDTPESSAEGTGNSPRKKALVGHTDSNFRQFDLNYMDSEAWVKYDLTPFNLQKTEYGAYKAPSRVSEWRREFNEYVKKGTLPRLMLLRLGTDHTQGTKAGVPSPRAYVADNDYAIGQLVEIISHSPFWKKIAIFVLEDDAQSGEDHVDAHRSTGYVISPFIRQGTRDSRFYNTDSFLHTLDCLLDLPPLNQYVAIAPVLSVFEAAPENDAPYTAILPAKSLIAERNDKSAYRAGDSARLYHPMEADGGPDDEMNDIIWHAIKGRGVSEPPPHYGLRSQRAASGAKDKDDHSDID